jgi:predicted RNase H-like HicB family nuclease
VKAGSKYTKVVEWSEEDKCFIGTAPGLILGGCHGDDEQEVFEELCQLVDEVVSLYQQEGRPLPPPTSPANNIATTAKTQS